MSLKLNGWQGIGIVLSVIWFIGVAGYVLYNVDWRGFYVCSDTAWVSHVNKSGYFILSAKDVWKDCYNVGSFLVELFSKDFAVIAFGWLVGWLGFVITRWMRRFA